MEEGTRCASDSAVLETVADFARFGGNIEEGFFFSEDTIVLNLENMLRLTLEARRVLTYHLEEYGDEKEEYYGGRRRRITNQNSKVGRKKEVIFDMYQVKKRKTYVTMLDVNMQATKT